MTSFLHWLARHSRWPRHSTQGPTVAEARPWFVAAPSDPTQPLWLVPAYQRRQRSGDRLVQR